MVAPRVVHSTPKGLPPSTELAKISLPIEVQDAQPASPLQLEFDAWAGPSESDERDLDDQSVQVSWMVRANGHLESFPLFTSLRAYVGHCVEYVDDWLGVVHPRERERLRSMWQHAQLTRRAYATECRMLRHDWIYRDFSLHVVPFRSSESGELDWCHFAVDITARKQHQREREYLQWRTRTHAHAHERARLRTRAQVSEARFSRLLEASIIGIVVMRGRVIIEANDAFLDLLGYTREDLIAGRLHLDTITAPTSVDGTERGIHEALTKGTCTPFEKEYVRRDGTRVRVLVGSVLLDSDQPLFLTFVVDLTPRQKLEREREEACAHELAALEVSRNLDAFFATAAHDIRSPVTAALGMVQLAQLRAEQLESMLRARDAGEAEAATRLVSTLDTAQMNMDRLARMTQVLFDVAQARTGTLTISPVSCDLVCLLQGEVDAHRSATPDRTIDLQLPSTPSVLVMADADRIEEVIANYLSNALKYSEKDQPVTARLDIVDDAAVVSVRDEGVGIPRDELEQVWEPFHRAQGVEPVNKYGGNLGLGLHICKGIVELHPGGEVGVESEVGRGTTLWFSLPLSQGDAGG